MLQLEMVPTYTHLNWSAFLTECPSEASMSSLEHWTISTSWENCVCVCVCVCVCGWVGGCMGVFVCVCV